MTKRQPGHLRRRTLGIPLAVAVITLTVAGGVRAYPRPAAAPATNTPPAVPAAGHAGTYRVVGLGDSVPAGSQCGCTPYVEQVGRLAASRLGRAPVVDNLAQPGLTTAGLNDQLRQPAVQARLAGADLVLVTIGANDLGQDAALAGCAAADVVDCFQDTLDTQRSRLSAMLDRITALGTGRILVTGYWNVFLDGQVARRRGAGYVSQSDALTLADNALIASVAAAHGATYIDLYTPFKGDGSADDTNLLAADGDHPNAAGHALIARTLLAALTGGG